MPAVGAPIGNQHAARGKVWRDAINRALEARTLSRMDGKKQIDALAERLLDECETGDLAALKELGDRLDGKSAQAIIGDDNADPVSFRILERVIVRPKADDSNG